MGLTVGVCTSVRRVNGECREVKGWEVEMLRNERRKEVESGMLGVNS